MRRLFAILLFFVSLPSFAVAPVYTSFFSNKAVGGYDTVAYFTEHKPVKGNDKFSTEYNGAKWYFSSQNNLELFKKIQQNMHHNMVVTVHGLSQIVEVQFQEIQKCGQ